MTESGIRTTLCSKKSGLGQSELPSGRSLRDAERPVEELLITLGVGTEEEGPRKASKVIGLIP